MERLEGLGAMPKLSTHAPAADTAAVVTLAAPTDGSRHVIDWISWSYEKDNAAAETLILAIAGSTVATWYIPVGAATANPPPRHIPFIPPITAGKNEAVVVTLSACADTTKGAVNVGYR
jgi:hypothetical protein